MAQRTWFITGVSSGFGLRMTEQLLERGDRVVGTVLKAGQNAQLAGRYGDSYRGPITSSTSCDQPIFVDHATELSLSSDAVQVEIDWLR